MEPKPRLRFAPSPTGYLHIGGARTALFNWLWARKTGGTFVLRIEDTDQERSTRESVEAIFDSMRWLGLDWDEGPQSPDDLGGGPHAPYFQMKRLELYREHAERLVHSGNAYRCYCTKEETEAQRNAMPPEKRNRYRHDMVCPYRDKTVESDKPHVIRFRVPRDGEVVFNDLVFGEIRTPNKEQQDFVLLRSDGAPLYNFGAVVDDVQMNITMIARGRDHIINTPPQVMLYKALGYPLPTFAHLPMLMANKNEKLSKRHGSVSVMEYRDKGWLPDGLLSYLVRFGWSHGDDEVFTRQQLIDLFSWERVGRSDGIYDFKKCVAINQRYLQKNTTNEELAKQVQPFLVRRELPVREGHPRLLAAVATVRDRSETLLAMADGMDYYFRAQPEMDAKASEKFLVPANAGNLDSLADALARVETWEQSHIEEALKHWATEHAVELKHIGQPVRVALTGRSASPGLDAVMAVLGQQVSVFRLREGARIARERTGSQTP